MKRQEVIKRFCELVELVKKHRNWDGQHAADCFCDDTIHPNSFAFEKESEEFIKFIELAVTEKIERELGRIKD